MPKRSTRITLSNNTPFTLTLVDNGAQLCHGQWTGGWQPPSTIPSKTGGKWQSESGGHIPIIGNIATGTEGWIKYALTPMAPPPPAPPPPELVYIHWDNPYVWSPNTLPMDHQQVSTNDVRPPCNADQGAWDNGSFGGVPVTVPAMHELFIAGGSNNGVAWDWGTGPVGTGFDFALVLPAVIILGIQALQGDINIEIILGLRAKGSVDQTIYHFYDGTKGLAALAKSAGQPSLRKLFSL